MASNKNNPSKPSASASKSENPETGTQYGVKSWHPLFFILLLSFILYGNSIGNDYAVDDSIVITENQYTKKGIGGLGKIFTTDAFEGFFGTKKDLVAGGRYRPLSIATFAVEWDLFGKSPGISHFINVLLYGFIGILLFVFLKTLFPAHDVQKWWLGAPFLITLLYMVHPIHTEVVANIKGRDELLALLFLLITLISVFKYLDGSRPIWLAAASCCFFLSLLSKETALPFLAILPLTIWFFRQKNALQYLIGIAPVLLATAIYLALRMSVVGLSTGSGSGGEILNDPFVHATYAEQLATVARTTGIYLEKLFFPVRLSHDYYFNQIPVRGWSDPQSILWTVVHLGLLAAGLMLAKKKSPISYGILFYFLSFSITSNVLLPIGTTMGERFVFVPSLGFLIAVVFAVFQFGEKLKIDRTKITMVLAIGIGLLFAARTFVRNRDWKDNYTLFTHDAEISPNSAKVQTAVGGTILEVVEATTNPAEKDRLARKAVGHLKKAVEIYPEHGQAWLLLGNAYFHLNDFNQALQSFQTAVRFRPLLWDAWQNAAVTSRKIKRYDLASNYYRHLATRKEKDPEFWYDRAYNYEDWGKGDSAIWCYNQSLALNPRMAKSMGQIARVYGMQYRDYDRAVEFGEKAIAIDPTMDWLYENLGIAHAMKGDPAAAIAAFRRGLEKSPKSAKLYLNMGITYQNMGDSVAAKQHFQQAMALDPSIGK